MQPAVILCDRGTVDGFAYWPGPGDFWRGLGTTQEAELARYYAVIHLRVPPDGVYNRNNPLRLESVAEALAIDDLIVHAWNKHPHRIVIEAQDEFLDKAASAIEVIRREVPACCRSPLFPSREGHEAYAPLADSSRTVDSGA